MLKRMLVMALVAGLAAWVVSSCSSSKKFTTSPTGTLFTFVGDVPSCGVVNFRTSVGSMSLILKGTTTAFPLFGGQSTRQPFYKVAFGNLRDFTTILDLGKVPVGTYDKATITFSAPELVAFDPTATTPIGVAGLTLSTLSPQFNINPPLVITDGGVFGLQMDFNLGKSIILDNQGQVTTNMTPVMSFTPVTATANGGFGELDDLKGFVTSVTTTSTGTGFAGGFGFQTLSGTGPLVTANLTNSTEVCGLVTDLDPNGDCVALVPASGPPLVFLSQLLTGSFIEMDGYVDQHGNLVGNSIEVEDREIVEQNKLALIGTVVPNSITRDASGNVTQFSLYVSQEEPDDELLLTIDTTVVVNVSSSTIYQYSSRSNKLSANFASLPFDATSIKEGQELVVHGVFTKPPTTTPAPAVPPPTTVAAEKVYLKLQSPDGNFSSLVAAQADDKTGAFWLSTCSSGLFQGAPILVLTNGPAGVLTGSSTGSPTNFVQTTFVNLTGLSALTPQPALLVKGLLFYEGQGGTVNGVTVPVGTLVLLAKQVHQLD